MLVKISESDKTAVEYGCRLSDYKVSFYTVENAKGLVQAEILDMYGEEPSREMIWYLVRSIEAKLACDSFKERE